MIYCSGLLDRSHITRAPEAYELYRNRDIKPRDKEAVDYREAFGNRVPITLMACFDTVGSLGIPGLAIFKQFHAQFNQRYRFHDTTLNRTIQNALHAMAIDEMRASFDVTPMKKHPEAENQRVIQKWFPGVHGCVGGGRENNRGLSDTSLQWMIDAIGALELGLEFDTSVIPSGIHPDYNCEFKNDPGFYKLAGIKFREVGDSLEDLHESTIERIRNRQDYRPKNLEKLLAELNSK